MKISADMHTHTIASTHAYSTIIENANSAKEAGVKVLGMTDHGPKMQDAPDVWHFDNLKVIPRTINDVIIIKGVEANIIDYKGTIDITDYTMKQIEWVVASMHRVALTPSTKDEITEGYINIAKNPNVDCIGHCTTNDYPFDYEAVLRAFKENNKFVELNESSINNCAGAYDNAKKILEICKRMQIKICVNTDSHFCQLIGKIPLAEKLLNEINFPEELIANIDYNNILTHIKQKHPKIDL